MRNSFRGNREEETDDLLPGGEQVTDVVDDGAERAGRQAGPDQSEHEHRVLGDAMTVNLIDEVGHRSHPEQSCAIAPACRPTPSVPLNDRLKAFASCLATRQLCKGRVAVPINAA